MTGYIMSKSIKIDLSNLKSKNSKTYANNFISQKIRLLNMLAKSSKKISDILKKNLIHLGIDKKKLK